MGAISLKQAIKDEKEFREINYGADSSTTYLAQVAMFPDAGTWSWSKGRQPRDEPSGEHSLWGISSTSGCFNHPLLPIIFAGVVPGDVRGMRVVGAHAFFLLYRRLRMVSWAAVTKKTQWTVAETLGFYERRTGR